MGVLFFILPFLLYYYSPRRRGAHLVSAKWAKAICSHRRRRCRFPVTGSLQRVVWDGLQGQPKLNQPSMADCPSSTTRCLAPQSRGTNANAELPSFLKQQKSFLNESRSIGGQGKKSAPMRRQGLCRGRGSDEHGCSSESCAARMPLRTTAWSTRVAPAKAGASVAAVPFERRYRLSPARRLRANGFGPFRFGEWVAPPARRIPRQ